MDGREKGIGFLILYLTPSKVIAPLIPESLKVVNLLPAYTLCGFYGANYFIENSTYNEFRVIPALTRWMEKRSFYLSPLEPMTKPELIWEKKGRVICCEVIDGLSHCMSLKFSPIIPKSPFRVALSFIELRGEGFFHKDQLATNIGLSSSCVEIPSNSPLLDYPFKTKLFTLSFGFDQVAVKGPVPVFKRRPIIRESHSIFKGGKS